MESLRIANAGEWEHFTRQSFYALSLEALSPDFGASARMTGLGRSVRVVDLLTHGGSALRRTSGLVASEPSDDLLFLMQLSGRSRLEQGGRQLELLAGQATFCDPSEPYSVRSSVGRQFVSMIARRDALPPRTDAAAVRLQPLDLTLAPLRVFRLLAEEITSDAGAETDLEMSGIAAAASELLRSAAGLAVSSTSGVRSWSNETRLQVLKTYMVEHISDHWLSMDQVAAANGISTRQLRAIFAPEDSPAAFLRRERLRRARRDLADPRLSGLSVEQIAARSGYTDPSTFGKAYRGLFGETPRDARSGLLRG